MDNNIKNIFNLCTQEYDVINTKYFLCAALFNDGNLCKLSQQNIYSLVIINNFYDPFVKGYVDIFNNNDVLEISNNGATKLNSTGFKFNNNGRDLFIFSLKSNEYNGLEMAYLFVVYKTEDIYLDINDKIQKIKRVYLKDLTREYFEEINSWFSTANYLQIENENIDISQISNEFRSIPTGTAISCLILEVLKSISVIDEQNFDKSGPNVFYSSTANEKYIDTLKKLIYLHHSDSADNCSCFLNYRFDTNDCLYYWSFKNIATVFNNVYNNSNSTIGGESFISTFKINIDDIEFEQDKNNANIFLSKMPIGLIGGNEAIIENFFFTDLSTENNIKYFNSQFIYNYDIFKKEFKINKEDGNIVNIKQSFIDNYVNKNFYKYPNMPFNKNNLYNTNLNHKWNNYEIDTNLSIGRNTVLNNFLSFNNTIEFTITGDLNLQSGKFISVYMSNAPENNEFLNKLIGDYFITEVTHILNNKTYNTKVIAVKPYFYNKPLGYDNLNE